MHDLLIERDASRGREGNLLVLAWVAFEERNRSVAGIERIDGLIDFERLGSGLGHVAAQTQRFRHDLARLAHQTNLSRRFKLGGLMDERPQHGKPA